MREIGTRREKIVSCQTRSLLEAVGPHGSVTGVLEAGILPDTALSRAPGAGAAFPQLDFRVA
jgi:hypothetical protein